MNRKALLLYLRDLRDLEVAKHKINALYQEELQQYKEERHELKVKDYVELPEKPFNWGFTAIALFLLFSGGVFMYLEKSGYYSHGLNGIEKFFFGGVGALLLGGLIIAGIIQGWFTYFKEVKEAKKHNGNEKKRIQHNEAVVRDIDRKWAQRSGYLQKEFNRVTSLLNDYYSLNILANPYRNLSSVYYIYDYMSSSQETLKDTLIHERMENGIQRILDRLDYIVEQNQEIIFQNRMQEANSQRVIQQNREMLRNLQQVERNTNNAAQYAEVAAYYSEANAYFSLASYLKG